VKQVAGPCHSGEVKGCIEWSVLSSVKSLLGVEVLCTTHLWDSCSSATCSPRTCAAEVSLIDRLPPEKPDLPVLMSKCCWISCRDVAGESAWTARSISINMRLPVLMARASKNKSFFVSRRHPALPCLLADHH
jgi:hypothetical protein